MHAWVSLLTAATLLLHVALGCHWHHAHEGDAASAAVVVNDHDSHAHHDHGDQEQGEELPCSDDDPECAGMSCVYVAAGKVIVAAADEVAASLPGVDASLPIALTRHDGQTPPRAPAAVRPHLFYQVILI